MPLDEYQFDFITFCDQFWRENGCFPSMQDFLDNTKYRKPDVGAMLTDPLIRKHILARGIDPDQEKPMVAGDSKANENRKGKMRRLSDIQLATAHVMLNPLDMRSVTKKLEELGVSPTTYAGWKRSKVFSDYLKKHSTALLGEHLPEVRNSLVTNAVEGDYKSQKLLFEMTGEWRGAQNEAGVNFQHVIMSLIEILQKHITDPVILQKISQDILAIQNQESVPAVNIVKGEVEVGAERSPTI